MSQNRDIWELLSNSHSQQFFASKFYIMHSVLIRTIA